MENIEKSMVAIERDVAELKRALDYRKEIESLRSDFKTDGNRAGLEDLKKALDYQKEIAALRSDVTLQISYFKWVAWSLGICLALLGFFGFRAWSDLTKSAETMMSKQLNEMSDRYSNLSRAFSLHDSGRSAEALPYLTALYESNRYDEPVLRSLFHALNNVEDCDAIMTKAVEIRSDKVKFDRIKDPDIFNNIGNAHLSCFDVKAENLQVAKEMLDLSIKRRLGDDPLRRYPIYNLFAYHIISNDLARAKNYLESASIVVDGYPDFDGVMNEFWYKRLLKMRPTFSADLQVMLKNAKKLQNETFKGGK